MRDTCYLVLNEKGVVKMTKTVPALRTREIAFKLVMVLEDHHFQDKIHEVKLEVPVDIGREKKIKQFEFELKELKRDD